MPKYQIISYTVNSTHRPENKHHGSERFFLMVNKVKTKVGRFNSFSSVHQMIETLRKTNTPGTRGYPVGLNDKSQTKCIATFKDLDEMKNALNLYPELFI